MKLIPVFRIAEAKIFQQELTSGNRKNIGLANDRKYKYIQGWWGTDTGCPEQLEVFKARLNGP